MSYLGNAKAAIETLQNVWWNGKTRWKDINAWQACVIADTLTTYSLVAQDFDYVDVIEAAVNDNSGLSGNDDDLWSAIAALKLYYLIGDYSFYQRFVPYEFEQITTKYWDDVCGGGVWWDYRKTYKNAITNELWIQLLSLMTASGQDQQAWVQKAWGWFATSDMWDNALLKDGLAKDNSCQGTGQTWTYNQGVYQGAMASLPSMRPNPVPMAVGTGMAVIDQLTVNGVLHEPGHNADQKIFKGIYVRNHAYLLATMGSAAPQKLIDYLTSNAQTVLQKALNNGRISAAWDGSNAWFGAAPQAAGIDLFTAAARVTGESAASPSRSYAVPIAGAGTSESPCACEFNTRLYAAWKGAGGDKRIWYASTDSSDNWSRQWRVPSGVETDLSPAAASFNGRWYVFWKGTGHDDGVYYSSMDPAGNWNGPAKIPGMGSSAAPGVVMFQGRLYVVWRGVNKDEVIRFGSLDGNGGWSGATVIPLAETPLSPAVAVGPDGRLYSIWKGAGKSPVVFYSAMDSGNNWSVPLPIIGAMTEGTPTLACYNGNLYAAWKGVGRDTNVYFSSLTAGGVWNQPSRFVVPGRTERSPVIAERLGRLYHLRAGNPGKGVDENNILFSYIPYGGAVGF